MTAVGKNQIFASVGIAGAKDVFGVVDGVALADVFGFKYSLGGTKVYILPEFD